jgi:hypothetical protein
VAQSLGGARPPSAREFAGGPQSRSIVVKIAQSKHAEFRQSSYRNHSLFDAGVEVHLPENWTNAADVLDRAMLFAAKSDATYFKNVIGMQQMML